MDNADQYVLSQLSEWVAAGRPSWLCTVVKTWGSSPRPVGSLLCCDDSGQVAGSLSGGCIEEDLLEKLRRGGLAASRPEILRYGVSVEDTERRGLPCGGELRVLAEPFPDRSQLPLLRRIVDRINQRKCIERRVDVVSGKMTVEETGRHRPLKIIGDPEHADEAGKTFLIHTYGPRFRLLLIGAGQVSMYLADMARALDYRVIVCDPRKHLAAQWAVAGTEIVTDMPDDAVRRYANDAHSAVVALTHDPRIDDMGLVEALESDAYYVGAMGSARTSEKRRERLKLMDLSPAQIDRLHAPVGLPIGSKTPAEIAVAILAQLTAIRAGKNGVGGTPPE